MEVNDKEHHRCVEYGHGIFSPEALQDPQLTISMRQVFKLQYLGGVEVHGGDQRQTI